MSSRVKEGLTKFHAEKEFTSTGNIGASASSPWLVGGENQLRLAVENVGGSNSITVFGRIRNQSNYSTLGTIVGATSGTTIDISLIDEVYTSCTVYGASGGTPKLIASGFFKPAASSGSSDTASNLGAGTGVFASKSGADFQFKSLVEGPGIDIQSTATEITISSVSAQAPKLVATFDSDAGTVAGEFVKLAGTNYVTAIADNSVAEMPNGIFGVCFTKPSSILAEVIFVGIVGGYVGLTAGLPVFVDTSGLPSHLAPTVGMSQQVGFAVSSTEIFINIMQALRRS